MTRPYFLRDRPASCRSHALQYRRALGNNITTDYEVWSVSSVRLAVRLLVGASVLSVGAQVKEEHSLRAI